MANRLTFATAGEHAPRLEALARSLQTKNGNRASAQRFKVLTYLKEGGRLTPGLAKDLFGIGRLAARVYDVNRQQGRKAIAKRMVTVTTRSGQARVAEYYYVPESEERE